jgi:hypothetical protein
VNNSDDLWGIYAPLNGLLKLSQYVTRDKTEEMVHCWYLIRSNKKIKSKGEFSTIGSIIYLLCCSSIFLFYLEMMRWNEFHPACQNSRALFGRTSRQWIETGALWLRKSLFYSGHIYSLRIPTGAPLVSLEGARWGKSLHFLTCLYGYALPAPLLLTLKSARG